MTTLDAAILILILTIPWTLWCSVLIADHYRPTTKRTGR